MTETGSARQAPLGPPVAALHALLGAEPTRPLLTFYDDATGERTELSVRTTENWVAKTANLLVDGLGAGGAGSRDRLGLALPLHWQGAVWALAAWSAGLAVVPGAPTDAEVLGCEVVVVGEAHLAQVLEAAVGEVVGATLHPFNRPLAEPVPLVTDYAREVLTYGDRFAPVDPRVAAGVLEARAYDAEGLVAAAAAAAGGWGLEAGGRLLSTLEPTGTAGFLALVAPLVLGGSLVLVRNPDTAALSARMDTERVTARTS